MAQQVQKEEFVSKAAQFFQEADTSGDGSLTPCELEEVFKKLGANPGCLKKMFGDLDDNRDGKISFAEFTEEMNRKDPKTITECDLRAAFKELDADGNNKFTNEEAKNVAQKCRLNLTAAQLDTIIDAADADKSGSLDCEEFIKFYRENMMQ